MPGHFGFRVNLVEVNTFLQQRVLHLAVNSLICPSGFNVYLILYFTSLYFFQKFPLYRNSVNQRTQNDTKS